MSSLVVICSVLIASIYAQSSCNWVKESTLGTPRTTGVCTEEVSGNSITHKKWICAEDGSNTVTEETYSDAECTQLSDTSTVPSSWPRSCTVTAGDCQYAMMSYGCGSNYTNFPIPVDVCVTEIPSGGASKTYYYVTCTASGVRRITAQSISCMEGQRIVIGTNFGDCKDYFGTTTGADDEWKPRYCGTMRYGPTVSPTTAQPTSAQPSESPTTGAPTTAEPSASPTTGAPTGLTAAPTTAQPTPGTVAPSNAPSAQPTTAEPTGEQPNNAKCVLFWINFVFVIFAIFLV